ncbi:hypothetical protein [Streptomyces huiliensis]|uniref:hypothetical protein n=1 Tax=Streptomyces huiliensis TaxID=2876027 RepID=UPI001CBDAACA|nr:hypothetical protein [Streptomyces huiliensis]MBZ4318843.1 hypothetical protein [Streptomyces huiliensis]
MPARTRLAVVTLLAAASAVLLPVTGAAAADAPAAGRHETTRRPAAGTDGPGADARRHGPRVTHREHSGVSRPTAPLRPAGRLHEVRQNGLPQNGLPQNGLPQNGLPQNGLPQDGLRQDGLVHRRIAPERPVQRTKPVRQVRQTKQLKQAKQTKPAKPVKRHEAASNPVRRMVQAGQTVGGRRDVGKPLAVGGAALVAVGGGAYGLRLASRRRAAARPGA